MFRSVDRHEGVSYCAGGNLALVVWSGPSTLSANRWLIQRARADMPAIRTGGLFLQLIAEATSPPNAETRRYIQQEFADLLPRARRFVTVPLGDSFNQSVVRTIMRGMLLLSGVSGTAKIASNLDEGLSLIFEVATAETPPRPDTLRKLSSMLDEAGVPR